MTQLLLRIMLVRATATQCTYGVRLAVCSGCWRHISLPGDVIGKSKIGDVTSVMTGALAGADWSVLMCWKNTPCVAVPAAAGGGATGGACSASDTALLLTVAAADTADTVGPAAAGTGGGGAWMPGLGSGVCGPWAANMAACGDAAMKTGAPDASNDRMTGSAVIWPPPGGCDAMTPGIPVAPAHPQLTWSNTIQNDDGNLFHSTVATRITDCGDASRMWIDHIKPPVNSILLHVTQHQLSTYIRGRAFTIAAVFAGTDKLHAAVNRILSIIRTSLKRVSGTC